MAASYRTAAMSARRERLVAAIASSALRHATVQSGGSWRTPSASPLRPPPRPSDARDPAPSVTCRPLARRARGRRDVVRQPRQPQPLSPGRGPLRRDRARDGAERRLGDAAAERPQVFREAAAPVLGDRRRLSRVRRPRMDGAAVAGARGIAGGRSRSASPDTRWAAPRSAHSPRSRSRERSATPRSRRSSRSIPGSRSSWRSRSPALVIAQRAEATRGRAPRVDVDRVGGDGAGAMLSKGLIGIVLPGGALVVYTAITRDVALWRRLHIVSGLAIFLAHRRAVVRRWSRAPTPSSPASSSSTSTSSAS